MRQEKQAFDEFEPAPDALFSIRRVAGEATVLDQLRIAAFLRQLLILSAVRFKLHKPVGKLSFCAAVDVAFDQGRGEAIERNGIVSLKLRRLFGEGPPQIVENAANLLSEFSSDIELHVVGVHSV